VQFCVALNFGHLGKEITNIWKVLKRGAGEGCETWSLILRVERGLRVISVLNKLTHLKVRQELVWGLHRLLHGVANVTSSVASDETGFKDLSFNL
jgi:hypothetical protein